MGYLREKVLLDAGSFEIVVKGRLSPTLIAAIDGFDLSRCDQGITRLVGWIPDQSSLHGTLGLLRDLNIELVSVNSVETRHRQTRDAMSTDTPEGDRDA
jgi:hypothetical protein